jgi:outer membrane protein with beta-barrel domain
MKKILICILCFATVQGFGQIRLGVQGGESVANFWQTDEYTGLPSGLSTSPIGAFHEGIIAEMDLNSFLVLQPALLYYEQGTHFQNITGFVDNPGFDIDYSNSTLRVYSLRLPVNLVAKLKVTDKIKLFFGLGPFLSKSLSGTEKGYYTGDSLLAGGGYLAETKTINNKVKISSDLSNSTSGIANVSSLDVGGDILGGIEYKRFQLSFNFSRGLIRYYRNTYTNCGNTAWSFSLAYYIFGHNRKAPL